MTLKPGFHYDVPHAAYHADPCDPPSLSASIAKILVKESPRRAYYYHPRLGGGRHDDSETTERGEILHAMLLGGGRDIVVLDYDNYRKKDAQIERDQAREDGKIPVLAAKYERYKTAADALRTRIAEHHIAIEEGQHEVTAIWEQNGVTCRSLIDNLRLSDATIIDLKCTKASANPAGLARRMEVYGDHIQYAANVRAVETLQPELAGRVKMVFLYCEVYPPYEVVPAMPSGHMRDLGDLLWNRAVTTWRTCLARAEWPGYALPGATIHVDPAPWAFGLDALDAELR